MWDVKCIDTISDVMRAVKEILPEVDPRVLINFRLAILNYLHHPVTTMVQGLTISSTAEQHPYVRVDDDDMQFLLLNHEDFYNTVNRISYDNNPLTYKHSGCPEHVGACGGEYMILEKCPTDSSDWVHFQFMVGQVPNLFFSTIIQYLGQGI